MGLFSRLFGGGEPSDPDKARAHQATSAPTFTAGGAGRRILLVESSVVVAKMMELTMKDDTITVARDAGDAREEAAKGSFDVALVNCSTVDGGYDLIAALKPKMPVIVLAATFAAFDEPRAKKAGADAILTVPFEPPKLQAEIARVTTRFA